MRDSVRLALLGLASSITACAAPPGTVPSDDVDEKREASSSDDDTDGPTDSEYVAGSQKAAGGGQPQKATADQPKPLTATIKAGPKAIYGGSGYCHYETTLNDVAIDVRIAPEGITAATVKDVVVEKILDCQGTPIPPTPQQFTRTSSAKTKYGWHIEFTPTKVEPYVSLIVELTAKGTTYDATMTWQRLDQADALRWKASTTVTLAAGS